MEIIDSVKELEKVGFNRPQAETQVKVMGTFMKDYATKEDLNKGLNSIRIDIHGLRLEMDSRLKSIDDKFTNINERFDIMGERLDHIMESIPFKTALQTAGLLTAMGVFYKIITYFL